MNRTECRNNNTNNSLYDQATLRDVHCFIKINNWSLDTNNNTICGFTCGGCGCFMKIDNVIVNVINLTVIVKIGPHYYGLLLGSVNPHFLNQRETYLTYLRTFSN
jgi:hypothetical protein